MIVKNLLRKVRANIAILIVVNDNYTYDFSSKKKIPAEFLDMTVEDYYYIGDFESDDGSNLLINVISK